MVADKGKKQKVEEKEENHIDKELVLSIEKLQEIQDELEKVYPISSVFLYRSLFLISLRKWKK